MNLNHSTFSVKLNGSYYSAQNHCTIIIGFTINFMTSTSQPQFKKKTLDGECEII
jgi:hypothetical protein